MAVIGLGTVAAFVGLLAWHVVVAFRRRRSGHTLRAIAHVPLVPTGYPEDVHFGEAWAPPHDTP